MAFNKNKFDGHTLPEALLQTKRLISHGPEVAICDRGYKGKNKMNHTRIIKPGNSTKETSAEYKERMRKRFRERVGLEPVIGQLKSDHHLNKNDLMDLKATRLTF